MDRNEVLQTLLALWNEQLDTGALDDNARLVLLWELDKGRFRRAVERPSLVSMVGDTLHVGPTPNYPLAVGGCGPLPVPLDAVTAMVLTSDRACSQAVAGKNWLDRPRLSVLTNDSPELSPPRGRLEAL